MPEPDAALALSRRIAAFDVDGINLAVAAGEFNGSSQPPEGVSVPGELWPGLIARIGAQRLSGLAVAAASCGWLRLEENQCDELLDEHRKAMISALILERTLVALADALDERGIEFVVLKGPALAHSVYPDPAWRAFIDLDLLVRAADWRQACALLEEFGFQRELPEPRVGFDEHFGKAATHTNADGFSVDLHRTLVLGPFGLWMEPEELFGRTVPLSLGGRELRRLDDTMQELHACMHASLGWWPPLLMPLRDVVQVQRYGTIDWNDLAFWAERWRLRAVVADALRAATETLGVTIPEAAHVLMSSKPARGEIRALAAYTSPRRRRGGASLSTMRAIPGLHAKAEYVRALLLPDREFLAARMGTERRSGYVRRWLVPVQWIVRRGS